MEKLNFRRIMFVLLLGLVALLSTLDARAQNTFWQKTNTALIKIGQDDSRKIPLILIHGIHGTASCDERGKLNDYWNNFRLLFNKDAELQNRYSLYVFQYCSDKVEVSKIALELRDLIDENLTDRNHYLLAHSMGGLVAKSYMAETVHLKGSWSRKTGGDTTLEIITLATPHHGTPGANSPKTLEKHFATGWRTIYEESNGIYWRGSLGESNPAVNDSSLWNRSDLRWDNYDFNLDAFKGDLNEKLLNRNLLFQKYDAKLIAYSGYLETSSSNTVAKILAEISKYKNITIEISEDEKTHRRLSLANAGLFYGLGKTFGYTDGLVPFKSGLFCDNEQVISAPNTSLSPKQDNYVCISPARVRRFEAGEEGLVSKNEYPDANTLSIYKTRRGFDHLDMYKDQIVLSYVARDLKNFGNPPPPKSLPPVAAAEIPTLFLFDVSGSMNDNDKIGQARNSSLLAMRQIQENKRLGRGETPVSVWAFSGDCSPNTARQILPFTANLTQAENTLSVKIPRPDGGTPLPQAIGKATAQVNDYLNARSQLNEGRIILLSDGQSTCGEIRPAGVYSQASAITVKKIRFLTIGFGIEPGSAAERDLQYLASASGGQYFPAQNQQQLSRAFEKTIRVFLPKKILNASPEFENTTNAILRRDFQKARQFAVEYLKNNPSDAFGYYNLAVALEATSRYKGAAENYRKYLQFAPDASERQEINSLIEKLEADYQDQFFYYQKLLQSDLDYLKAYYQRLFNRENEKNAAEFTGFVAEKQSFYANLTDIMEIRSARIERDAKDLSDSLGVLNRRVGLPSFDRDAVSLLTISIGQLEDVTERLENYKNQNTR